MNVRTTKNAVVWRLVIGMVLVMSSSSFVLAKSDSTTGNYYTAKDKEYYLTADEIYFIRPGLEIAIESVDIGSDNRPEVTFSVKDPGGLALDVNGITTPGAIDFRYSLTQIPQGQEQKQILTPGTGERSSASRTDGVFTALGNGMYSYKFLNALPDFDDPDATHVLGVAGRRDLAEFDLDRYSSDALYTWVPSGKNPPQGRDVVRVETCNGRCHDPLALHGGRYYVIDMCTQCHNPTHPDGPVYSFNVMIHKIHDAQDFDGHEFADVTYPAPLNDCETCHTGGIPTKNFPLVANPNPVPVCDYSGRGTTELTWAGAGPYEIHLNSATGPKFVGGSSQGSKETGNWVKEGTTFYLVNQATGDTVQKLPMHTTVLGCTGWAPKDPQTGEQLVPGPGRFRGVPGLQHTNWLDHPSRAVCGSCHTDVNFETGENHLGGAYEDDSLCSICHVPDSGNEYDRSIRGAHTVEYKSKQLPGLLVKIVDVTNTSPGNKPTVKFQVGTKNGPLDPASLNRLRFAIAGPNTDFSFYAQETVGNKALQVGETNMWTYTFNTALPANAKGSYTVGFEGRNDATINMGAAGAVDTEDQAQDDVFAFAVTDAVATPRRRVVEDYNCEACHTNLSLHGGNRNDPQYCVTCHRPDATDAAVRPADTGPPEGIHFKWLVHHIHRGEELSKPYVVYGYGGSLHDEFNEVTFPGDLRNCDKCHENHSELLPLPLGVLATTTPRALWTPTQPIAAACQGCHDDDTTATHVDAMTSPYGESCPVCHGQDADFDVEKVHAR